MQTFFNLEPLIRFVGAISIERSS